MERSFTSINHYQSITAGNDMQTASYPASDVPLMATNPAALDPTNSERQIYRSSYNGQQREIWRPGDGDGEVGTDYFERVGDPLPLEKRWRLFQCDIGPLEADKNEPPKYVFLDDRAAWDIIQSNIARSHLAANWPHDFGGAGRLRARRPHRGREALKDPNAEGDNRYHSLPTGKQNIYYLTGEKNYVPVTYQIVPKPAPQKRRFPSPDQYNPRAHGHNQYTPKDQLVKNGAPSFSKDIQIRQDRKRRIVGGSPSPPWLGDAKLRATLLRSSSLPPSALTHQRRMITRTEQPESGTCGGSREGMKGGGRKFVAPFSNDEDDETDARGPESGRGSVQPRREESSDLLSPPAEVADQQKVIDKLMASLHESRVARNGQEEEIATLEAALAASREEAARWKGKFERLAAGL